METPLNPPNASNVPANSMKRGFASRLASKANEGWKHLRKKVMGGLHLLKIAGQLAKEDQQDFLTENEKAVDEAISGESGVQLMVESKRDLKDINWQKQGNAEFYTEAAIKGRHLLRTDPNIVREIQKWWRYIPKEMDGTPQVHIIKPVYEAVVVVIQLVLLPNFGMKGDMNYDPEEDWLDDNKGMEIMAYPNFFDAMFELADMWCESVSAMKYAEILAKLLKDTVANEHLMRKMFKRFGYQVPPWWPGDPPAPAPPPPPPPSEKKKKLRKPSPPPPFIRPFIPKPEVPKVKRRPVSARPLNWKPPITAALYEAEFPSSTPVYATFPTSIEVIGGDRGQVLAQPYFFSPQYPRVSHEERAKTRPMDRWGNESTNDLSSSSALTPSYPTQQQKMRPRTAHMNIGAPPSRHDIALTSFIAPAPSAFSRTPAWFASYMTKAIAKHKKDGGIPLMMKEGDVPGAMQSPKRSTSPPPYGRERARQRSASPPSSPLRGLASRVGSKTEGGGESEWSPLTSVVLLPPTDLPDKTSSDNQALLILHQLNSPNEVRIQAQSPPREREREVVPHQRQRPMTAQPRLVSSPRPLSAVPAQSTWTSVQLDCSTRSPTDRPRLPQGGEGIETAFELLPLNSPESPAVINDSSKRDRSSQAFREKFGPPPAPPLFNKPRPSSARISSLNETDIQRLNQLKMLSAGLLR